MTWKDPNDLINTSITLLVSRFHCPRSGPNVISALDSPAYLSSSQVDNPVTLLLSPQLVSFSVESVFPVSSSLEYRMRTFCEAASAEPCM